MNIIRMDLKRSSTAALGALSIAAQLAAASTSLASTPETQLLKERAWKANQACGQFFESADRIEGGLSKREVFSSKAVTLRELSLAERYPGFPGAAAEILSFLAALPGDKAVSDGTDVGELYAAATSCGSARFYGMLSRLIRSARLYRLGHADRDRLAAVISRQLEADRAGPRTTFDVSLDLRILALAERFGILSTRRAPAAAPPRELLSNGRIEEGMSLVVMSGPNLNNSERSAAFKEKNSRLLDDIKAELRQAETLQRMLK